MDWDALYAHLITSLGWTWDYIDEHMTLPRLTVLSAYWQNHPPTHIALAAFLDIKPTPKTRPGMPEFATIPDVEE